MTIERQACSAPSRSLPALPPCRVAAAGAAVSLLRLKSSYRTCHQHRSSSRGYRSPLDSLFVISCTRDTTITTSQIMQHIFPVKSLERFKSKVTIMFEQARGKRPRRHCNRRGASPIQALQSAPRRRTRSGCICHVLFLEVKLRAIPVRIQLSQSH